jgi:hypothetical protein
MGADFKVEWMMAVTMGPSRSPRPEPGGRASTSGSRSHACFTWHVTAIGAQFGDINARDWSLCMRNARLLT